MNSEPSIICPSCKTSIKLTESLAGPLLEATKKQYEARLKSQEDAISQREAALQAQQVELYNAKESLESQVQERIKTERITIAKEEAQKAKQLLGSDLEQKSKELADLQEVLKEKNTKLAEAQNAQAQLMIKERELNDARNAMNLTIQQKVHESLEAIKLQARNEAEEALQLKVLEKEQTIKSMQQQIEELRKKAEQGSQQLQGEVLELQLESLLRSRFPHDTVVPVPKGEFGGDVVQRVFSPFGQSCGSILWESKRTKNWSDGWLTKLRDDQRVAKAEVAIIVSQTLPKDVEIFDCIEGVWVTSVRSALPVALALRQALLDLAAARQAGEGQQTKMEMVYNYMIGAGFRQRVQAIVEKFNMMQDDLNKERTYLSRMWAKRQQQIHSAIEAAMGMRGDLEGIAGKAIKELDGLDVKLLESEE